MSDQTARLSPRDVMLESLAELQDVLRDHAVAAHELKELTARWPARPHAFLLTATRPVASGDRLPVFGARAFTVINPNAINLTIGYGGIGATNALALTLPGTAVITLPITPSGLEIGARAADMAAGDAVVHALFYDHVEPFFFGGWVR